MKKMVIGVRGFSIVSAVFMAVATSAQVGESFSSDKNPDAYLNRLMSTTNGVYEVYQGWTIDNSVELQPATALPAFHVLNEIKCLYNNRRHAAQQKVNVGEHWVIKKVSYKLSQNRFMYQVDIAAYDKNNKPLADKDYPIQGLICVTQQRIQTINALMQTGTGGDPIFANESLYQVNGDIYTKLEPENTPATSNSVHK